MVEVVVREVGKEGMSDESVGGVGVCLVDRIVFVVAVVVALCSKITSWGGGGNYQSSMLMVAPLLVYLWEKDGHEQTPHF